MTKTILIHQSGLILAYHLQSRSFYLTRNAYDALALTPGIAQALLNQFTTNTRQPCWHLLEIDLPSKNPQGAVETAALSSHH